MGKLFSGFSESKAVTGGGVYLNSGHRYRLKIERISFYDGRNGEFLIHEFMIVESDDPTRPVGTGASWLVKYGTDMTFPNFKAFLAAANGIDPGDQAGIEREITDEVAELAVSEAQPLRGMLVDVSVVEVTTKKGTPFSKHVWKPVSGQDKNPVREQVMAAKAPPPPPPVPAVVAKVWPPSGWAAHPSAPGYFYKGQEVLSEAQLRAL